MSSDQETYQLIITIVDKGSCSKVVEASKKAGAEGGTIIYGRGTGIHENQKLFSLLIEPEKEIVLTLIPKKRASEVMQAIIAETNLNEPGKGIAFILDVEATSGIAHKLKKENS